MRRRVLVAAILAAMVAGVVPALASGSQRALTGEDYFRGVFFVDGPAVERIASLDRIAGGVEMNAESRSVQAQLIGAIERSQPQFFDRFERAMSSGDHLRIDAALLDAAEVLVEVAESDLNLDVSQRGEQPDACSIGIFVCVWTVGVAYNWVGGVNVAVAVLAWVTWVEPGDVSPQGQLAYDELVNDLARLAG